MKFEDIQIGLKKNIKHKITKKDVELFIRLSGDKNLIHTSKNYSDKTTLKKPIIHGMISASFISTVLGNKLPGKGSLWLSQNLEFLLPVRIGDELNICAEVQKINNQYRIIELDTIIYNQYNQIVTRGLAKVKVLSSASKNLKTYKNKKTKTSKVKKNKSVYKSRKDNKFRNVLVLGGSGGIGSSICKKLSNDGYNICVHYFSNLRSAKSILKKLNNNKNNIKFKCNIIEQSNVKKMIAEISKKMGTIDVLINCVSKEIIPIEIENLNWKEFQDNINLQIKGLFFIIKEVLPTMKSKRYGKIININSISFDMPNSKWLPYIASKGALMGFTKALAVECCLHGINVNSVSPGMTDTKLISNIPEIAKLSTALRTPARRIANPEDIANAVSFLASQDSDFLCGEVIRVNGGSFMI